MGRTNLVQTNFSSGELGPFSLGRVDTKDFFNGAKAMYNFIPLKGGGAVKRNGCIALKSSYESGDVVDFSVPFYKANTGTIVLRIKDNAIAVGDVFEADIVVGSVTLSFVGGLTTLQGYGLSSEYLNYVQINNVLIITAKDGDFPPVIGHYFPASEKFIFSYFHEGYQFNLDLNADGLHLRFKQNFVCRPYMPRNTNTGIKLKLAAVSGSTTLSAEDGGAAPINMFTADSVGVYYKIHHVGSVITGIAQVTAYISASSVTVTMLENAGATTATDNWQESAWSNVRGWPKNVIAKDERLCFMNTTYSTDTLWFSALGDIHFFMQDKLLQDVSADTSGYFFFGAAASTDPFNIAPSSDRNNEVLWALVDRSLIIGTRSGIYTVSGVLDALELPGLPKQCSVALVQAVSLENSLAGVDIAGKIYEVKYNENISGFESIDISTLNENITHSDGKICYVQSFNALVFKTSSTEIGGIVFGSAEKNYAFFRILVEDSRVDSIYYVENANALGGVGGLGLTLFHTVESKNILGYIPKPSSSATKGGNFSDLSTWVQLDAGGDVDLTAETYLFDGNSDVLDVVFEDYLGEFSPVGGVLSVGIAYANEFVWVGKRFDAYIQTVPIELNSLFGSSFPIIKRIERILFRLWRTQYLQIGTDLTAMDDVDIDVDSETFSGVTEQHHLDISYGEDSSFYISSNNPLPCNIVAVGMRGSASD